MSNIITNLFNINISNIRYDGTNIKLIKLGGNIIYEKLSLYVPYEFKSDKNLTEVKTIINESHTDLSYMFYNCKKLEHINTEDWDTSNVINMKYMFYNCDGLTSLDLSNFNTTNVTNMSNMFNYCGLLNELDVSTWDTSNVTDMGRMFTDCKSLISLDLSDFNTNNVTNMHQMFGWCSELEVLDLSNWHIDANDDIGEMFYGCNSLHTLRLDNCDLTTIKWLTDLNYPSGTYYDGISTYFPTSKIEGVTRTIYCRRDIVGELVPPKGWEFVYID